MKTTDINKRIAFIRRVREDVMDAAEQILSPEMEAYAKKFGWDRDVDSMLWAGITDCGVEYLIANGNVTNTANARGASEHDAPQ